MSEEIDNNDKSIIQVLNASEPSKISNVKTPTKFKSETLKKVTTRKPILKKTPINVSPHKNEARRRSLTMNDIRTKTSNNSNRTPLKQIKKDSCSTADQSPKSPKEQSAEKMLSIRCRELQVRTFSKLFYNLWKKQQSLAQNYKDEVTQLQLQKSFLINLRDKESERREEITKVADKQKKEIIDLMEQLAIAAKDQQYLLQTSKSLQEINGDATICITKSYTDLDTFHDESQRVIIKIQEINDLMVGRSIGLKHALHWAEDVYKKTQQHLAFIEDIKEDRNTTTRTIENLTTANESLLRKIKSKEENEKNLKESVRELRKSLENIIIKNENLKSEVKNIKLQLEYAEHQIEELKFQPCTWSDLAKKAAKVSMVLLLQAGLLPTF